MQLRALGKKTDTVKAKRGRIPEYDKPFHNRNKINNFDTDISMGQEGYEHLERKQNNMQLILEFPKKPENEETIKREVKEILSGILLEYLKKGGCHE